MKPRLIHPREITLYRIVALDRDVFGDPVDKGIVETGKILKGQVSYASYDRVNLPGGGDDPQGAGHVLFYTSDWEEAGGMKGDELVLSPSDSRLVVIEVRPCGHYHGVAYFQKVIFARKSASVKGAVRQ